MAEKTLKITWTKSTICTKEHHRGTIKALGLKRLHHSVVKKDTPQLRGMIRAVEFLVKVEEVQG
jgi:large subunit ribosomal protein L30